MVGLRKIPLNLVRMSTAGQRGPRVSVRDSTGSNIANQGVANRNEPSLSRLVPRKLQLQRNIGVLFSPEGNERGLQPAPQRSEPMHARMAAGAERNEQLKLMNARLTMMNG